MIGAVMWCVGSVNTFASLGEEFHINGSTLHSFDRKFWKWFRQEYWNTWVDGVSGVGFDDITSIDHVRTRTNCFDRWVSLVYVYGRRASSVGVRPLPNQVAVWTLVSVEVTTLFLFSRTSPSRSWEFLTRILLREPPQSPSAF